MLQTGWKRFICSVRLEIHLQRSRGFCCCANSHVAAAYRLLPSTFIVVGSSQHNGQFATGHLVGDCISCTVDFSSVT